MAVGVPKTEFLETESGVEFEKLECISRNWESESGFVVEKNYSDLGAESGSQNILNVEVGVGSESKKKYTTPHPRVKLFHIYQANYVLLG